MVDFLYKYEPPTAQALENLKAQSIYFGSPQGFNDPYDCATYPFIVAPTELETVQIRSHYLEREQIPDQARREFEIATIESLQEIFLVAGKSAIHTSVENFMSKKGVSCFSESNDDLLMWSHYGGHYKGFCLEFSTAHRPFNSARKVTYQANIPTLQVAPYLIPELRGEDGITELFCTKSSSWSYEKEWRIIHQVAGTLYTYDAQALTGIYFGPEISRHTLEIICLIIKGQNPNVKFWRGMRSPIEFKVEFEQTEYTSYIDAKTNGLI